MIEVRTVGLVLVACVALGLAGCPRRSEGPWLDEDLGRSRRGPAVLRDRGTLEEARARWDAAEAPGDRVMAAVDVAALGGDLEAMRGAIHAAIDDATEAELIAAADAAEPALEPVGAIALRLALIAHHRGDDESARGWLVRFSDAADAGDPALAERGRALAAETAPADPKLVAVLLPLSGRYASLGEELRAAIEAAPRDGASLAVIDTAGDEAGAAAAVDRAAARGAVAILGPVGERESVAAARRAAELGIPIALLAPDDGADPDAGVFRVIDSPADEARGAARLAARESYPTAAVLAPRDDIGESMAQAFADEAAAQGITVARIGFYDPTASDLQPDIKAFLGLDPKTNKRLARHLRKHGKKGWQTFSPDIDFSLLYLPDRYDRAALAVAFLPYLGVELSTTEVMDPDLLARKHGGRMPQVVQLLGSSGWNHPGLITRGGDDVEGALFVDSCAGALDELSGYDASSPALQALDAARIVLEARARAAREEGEPRENVRRALARASLDDGACPPSQMGQDGELAREPVVVMIDAGQFVLQSF